MTDKMTDKSTSDEKLLKLIEGTSSVKPIQKVGLKPKGRTPFSFLSFPRKFDPRAMMNLQNINKGLFVVCGLLTLLFLIALISGPGAIRADLIFPSGKGGSPAKGVIQQANSFLGLQEYLNEISKRNMFLPPEIRATGPTEMAPNIAQLFQDVKLVGIIWSKNPEAMVENSKENRTYLLKKGDTFGQQQLKVKEVTHNSVILEIEGEGKLKDYELR